MRIIKHGKKWLICGVVTADSIEEAAALLFDHEELVAERGRLM